MDNIRFGQFIAQRRKELGMTQKDLADKLCVTDKAVSKWETGKGCPDVKLLEALAQTLEVSLVELIRGERQLTDHLTVDEAAAVVSQAMDHSERITARRYLTLFRWTLVALSLSCGSALLPYLRRIAHELYTKFILAPQQELIGNADGPTTIIIGTATVQETSPWLRLGFPVLMAVCFLILSLRVRKLERKLDQ